LTSYTNTVYTEGWKFHRRLGNKIVTSMRRYTTGSQRLDGEASISYRWHQVSWQSQVIWSVDRTNHRTACRRLLDVFVLQFSVTGDVKFIVGRLSWDIRLFVWSKFHFFRGIAVPRRQTCYEYHFICMPGVFHETKKT